jgi:hypothetical protein
MSSPQLCDEVKNLLREFRDFLKSRAEITCDCRWHMCTTCAAKNEAKYVLESFPADWELGL